MTNPRELLGNLYHQRAQLDAQIVATEQAVIQDIQHRQHGTHRPDLGREITLTVAATLNVNPDFLTTPSKNAANVEARALAYLIARQFGWTLPRIGAWARRDHTTVHHALRTRGDDAHLVKLATTIYQQLNETRAAA